MPQNCNFIIFIFEQKCRSGTICSNMKQFPLGFVKYRISFDRNLEIQSYIVNVSSFSVELKVGTHRMFKLETIPLGSVKHHTSFGRNLGIQS